MSYYDDVVLQPQGVLELHNSNDIQQSQFEMYMHVKGVDLSKDCNSNKITSSLLRNIIEDLNESNQALFTRNCYSKSQFARSGGFSKSSYDRTCR